MRTLVVDIVFLCLMTYMAITDREAIQEWVTITSK